MMHYNDLIMAEGHAPQPVLPGAISFAVLLSSLSGPLAQSAMGITPTDSNRSGATCVASNRC